MNASKILASGYDELIREKGRAEIEDFESVRISGFSYGGDSRNLRQCLFQIKRNRGTTYAALDKKGRIVRKFMGFLIGPIVCAQNNIDSNFTSALEELYRLNRERDRLSRKISDLENRLAELERAR